MKVVEESINIADTTEEHSNSQYCGYCCPHCLQTNDHDLYTMDEANAVECDHCGKIFVIWNKETIRQCSGYANE